MAIRSAIEDVGKNQLVGLAELDGVRPVGVVGIVDECESFTKDVWAQNVVLLIPSALQSGVEVSEDEREMWAWDSSKNGVEIMPEVEPLIIALWGLSGSVNTEHIKDGA